METSLLEAIPLGTDADEAERRLASRNFSVRRVRNDSFSEQGTIHENIDYLFGDRHDGVGVTRRWQVALVLDGDRVVDVLVSTGVVGP